LLIILLCGEPHEINILVVLVIYVVIRERIEIRCVHSTVCAVVNVAVDIRVVVVVVVVEVRVT